MPQESLFFVAEDICRKSDQEIKMQRPMTLTVTEVNEYIKMLLDGNALLSDVMVKGEISNFTNH